MLRTTGATCATLRKPHLQSALSYAHKWYTYYGGKFK